MEGDSDSDAPEQLTACQGMEKEEEIRKIIKDNKIRVTREAKERRRRWALNKSRPVSDLKVEPVVEETEMPDDPEPQPHHISGMLPESIVSLLAAREKLVFPEGDEVAGSDQCMSKKKKRGKLKVGGLSL